MFCVCVGGLSGLAKELMTEFADSLPGIDEAKSFLQVMRYSTPCLHTVELPLVKTKNGIRNIDDGSEVDM